MSVIRRVLITSSLFLSIAASVFGQSPVTVQNNDHDCELSIDGRGLGTFTANASRNFPLQPGSHFFVCMNSSIAKAKDQRKQREVLLESSVTMQISGSNPVTVKMPRLTVEAKNTYGAPARITGNPEVMTDQCRAASVKGAELSEVVTVVDGSIRSCNGMGSYLLVRSGRSKYLVPMQQVKLFVAGSDSEADDTLFDIKPNQ